MIAITSSVVLVIEKQQWNFGSTKEGGYMKLRLLACWIERRTDILRRLTVRDKFHVVSKSNTSLAHCLVKYVQAVRHKIERKTT